MRTEISFSLLSQASENGTTKSFVRQKNALPWVFTAGDKMTNWFGIQKRIQSTNKLYRTVI